MDSSKSFSCQCVGSGHANRGVRRCAVTSSLHDRAPIDPLVRDLAHHPRRNQTSYYQYWGWMGSRRDQTCEKALEFAFPRVDDSRMAELRVWSGMVETRREDDPC